MEDKRGIGGRIATEILWSDIILNENKYSVGLITKMDDTVIYFVIDTEDKERVKARSWHYMASGYIGSSFKVGGQRKVMYLHNLIMNRLEFDGKGAEMTVDHINGNGLDNRKKNLRVCSQSQQNRNTKKRARKTEKLPEDIDPDDMPTNVWYAPPHGLHGDRFIIEIKGILDMDDIVWKSTSSKSVSTREKLTSAVVKRQELIDKTPALKYYIREAELSRQLQAEFDEIVSSVVVA